MRSGRVISIIVCAVLLFSLPVPAALADNDAYRALDRIGALIRTGPTGTNVGDLTVLLTGEAAENE